MKLESINQILPREIMSHKKLRNYQKNVPISTQYNFQEFFFTQRIVLTSNEIRTYC